MRVLAPITAAFALCAAQVAAAAETMCLTPREATAVATYAMPSVINGTAQRCGTALGKDSYLAKNGAQLSQRYVARKAAAWPEAKGALLRVGGKGQMLEAAKSLPDATVQQLADTLVSSLTAEHVPVKHCTLIDRALWLLAPLPPESTTELIGLSIGLFSQGDQPKLLGMPICKA